MKKKMPLDVAYQLASRMVEELREHCQRIELAGSIRRSSEFVGDIELVAIPNFIPDMFGDGTSEHELDAVDWSKYGRLVKGGSKYKQIELKEGINLDLFIVTPPAQWGVQFLIRTGPADFSRKFVTKRMYGGMLPSNMQVKGGAIWEGEKMHITPTEMDVFKLIDQPFIDPRLRN